MEALLRLASLYESRVKLLEGAALASAGAALLRVATASTPSEYAAAAITSIFAYLLSRQAREEWSKAREYLLKALGDPVAVKKRAAQGLRDSIQDAWGALATLALLYMFVRILFQLLGLK